MRRLGADTTALSGGRRAPETLVQSGSLPPCSRIFKRAQLPLDATEEEDAFALRGDLRRIRLQSPSTALGLQKIIKKRDTELLLGGAVLSKRFFQQIQHVA